MRSPILLAEFVRALLNEGQGIKAEAGARELFRRINLEAGTKLLEVLPRDEIRAIILDHLDDIMSKPELVSQRSKLRNRKPAIRSLSLGAGVQSTVLALMADRGEHGLPKPDVAVFADTGWEPPHVYEHLDWLESQLSFEVVRVNNGNLRENIMKGINPRGKPYLTIPAFLVNPDGTLAIASRQCTSDYKVKPIHDYLRQRLGLAIREDGLQSALMLKSGWVLAKMRSCGPSPVGMNGSRVSVSSCGFRVRIDSNSSTGSRKITQTEYLPRSSCIGCPYHTDMPSGNGSATTTRNRSKTRLKSTTPSETTRPSRPASAKKADAYLHRLRRPLAEIDLSDTPDYDSMMLDECEGVCGV